MTRRFVAGSRPPTFPSASISLDPRVGHVGVGMIGVKRKMPLQFLRQPNIIPVEQGDVLTTRFRDPDVHGGGLASVRPLQNTKARVGDVLNTVDYSVRRPVIDHDHF